MQSFKTYLAEASAKNLAPWQDPSNPAYVNVNVSDYFRGSVKRNKNGTYSTSAPHGYFISCLKLDNGKQYVLPVKFSIMSYFETISGVENGLTTLQGCPDTIRHEMVIDSKNLTTLDYLYTQVHWKLSIQCPNLKTFGDAKTKCLDLVLYDIGDVPLKEVQYHVEVIHTIYLGFDAAYKKPVLSIFKIKGHWVSIEQRTSFDQWKSDPDGSKAKEFDLVCKILSKYAKSRNAIACQRELIENDLDEYAEF
jgi:hypothetical protein